MNLLTALILTAQPARGGHATPPPAGPRARPAASRPFVPDDSDPCAFERFRADPALATWLRETAPNVASSATCYHAPAKILPVASRLLGEIDRKTATVEVGARADLRAAALTGYQIDSLIEVEREGKRQVGVILRSGVNGPTFSQVYLVK